MAQLPTAAGFDCTVDENQPTGNHALGVRAAVYQIGQLQKLAEANRFTPDRHVTDRLRHNVRLAK